MLYQVFEALKNGSRKGDFVFQTNQDRKDWYIPFTQFRNKRIVIYDVEEND